MGPYFPYNLPNVEAAVSDHDNNKIDTIAMSYTHEFWTKGVGALLERMIVLSMLLGDRI